MRSPIAPKIPLSQVTPWCGFPAQVKGNRIDSLEEESQGRKFWIMAHTPKCGSYTLSSARIDELGLGSLPLTIRFIKLHGVCLLLRHVADHRQLVHLSLISLQQEDDPNDEASHTDQQVQRKCNQCKEGDEGKNSKTEMKHEECPGKKKALPGVESNEPILVVRLQHQKDDCRNNRDVSQHTGHVIRHALGTGGGYGRNGSATATCSTSCCAIGDLRAPPVAKI